MPKKVAQMIEEQIHFWMHKNDLFNKPGKLRKKLPIITVSREFGAHGAALAELLGSKLSFKVWDKDLLVVISEKLGTNQEFLESLDETRRDMVEDTILGFLNQRHTNLNYMIYLVKAVRALERFGNNIIVGRGANYICQNPNSFHIRVVSPVKTRIDNYAERNTLSREEASSIILRKEAERNHFIKSNFNRDVNDSSDYDLILNSSTFSLEEMAEIALLAYEKKIGMRVADDHQKKAPLVI